MFGDVPKILGRNRKSRGTEAAGRRNYPEAVPKRRGRKKKPVYQAKSRVQATVAMRIQGESLTN